MSMVEHPVLSPLQLKAALQERLEPNPCPTQVVCFDFFDTLVSRMVVPEETKIIAARQLADTMAAGITGDFIYQLRRVLEHRLCAENHAQGLDPEFSLPVLAQRLHAVLGGLLGETVVPPAKSMMPIFCSQPSPQTQCAIGQYTRSSQSRLNSSIAEKRTRSA